MTYQKQQYPTYSSGKKYGNTYQQDLKPGYTNLLSVKQTFTLEFSDECKEQIRYLCHRSPSEEWSGVLFYSMKGSFKNLGSLVVTCEHVFLKNIGDSVFTTYTMDEEVSAYMMKYPHLMQFNLGKLHSHQKMSVFHSDTDMKDLWESTEVFNYYLSVIVNNRGEIDCKLAWRNEIPKERYNHVHITDDSGNKVPVPYELEYDKQWVFLVMNGVSDKILPVYNLPDDFMNRFDEIDEDRKKIKSYQNTYMGGGYQKTYSPPSVTKHVDYDIKIEEFLKDILLSDNVSHGIQSLQEDIEMGKDVVFTPLEFKNVYNKRFTGYNKNSIIGSLLSYIKSYEFSHPLSYKKLQSFFVNNREHGVVKK